MVRHYFSRSWNLVAVFLAIFFLAVTIIPVPTYAVDIFNNQRPGFNRSAFGVSLQYGSIVQSFPIEVPEGVNGIQPDINILYSSHQKNGSLGVGWELELGAIEINTKRGIPKYNSTDTYVLVENGGGRKELAFDATLNFYRPRIEESFLKAEHLASPDRWVLTDRNGTKYSYGLDEASRQNDSTKIFRWALSRVEDIHGNYMTITYTEDTTNRQHYPQYINYTGNTTSTPTLPIFAEVEFQYQTRTTDFRSYQPGFLTKTNKRLQNVLVKAGASENLQRKYVFAYSSSAHTQRDLLNSITQYGSDGTTALPAVEFTYYGSEKGFTGVTLDAGWDALAFSAPVSAPENYRDLGVRIVDVNSDSFPDIVKSYASQSSLLANHVYLYDKVQGTWIYNASWVPPVTVAYFPTNYYTSIVQERLSGINSQFLGSIIGVDMGFRFGDVNGDGRTDILKSFQVINQTDNATPTLMNVKEAYLNNLTGWTANSSSWLLPSGQDLFSIFKHWQSVGGGVTILDFVQYQHLGNQLIDVNNDGYTDFVTAYRPPATTAPQNLISSRKVFLNNALNGSTGWTENTAWVYPSATQADLKNGGELVDLNGDGLAEIFYASGSTVKVYMNTGAGWTEDISSPWKTTSSIGNTTDGSTQFADINGDGLSDLIVAKGGAGQGSKVLINTGDGWLVDDAWILPEANFLNLGTRILDKDADTLNDFMINVYQGTRKLYSNNGQPTDILKSIDNNKGAVTTIAYRSSSDFNHDQSQNFFMPFALIVVDTVTTQVQVDETSTQQFVKTYSYENGYWDAAERDFRGFYRSIITEPEGHFTQTYYWMNDYYRKNRVFIEDKWNSLTEIVSKTQYNWNIDATGFPGNVRFVRLGTLTGYAYDDLGNVKYNQENYTYGENPQLGNMTNKTELGEVALQSGQFVDVPNTDTRTTITSYVNNLTNRVIGRPSASTIFGYDNQAIRHTQFYYDGSLIHTQTPVKGLLTGLQLWAGNQQGAVHPFLQYQYNGLGLLKKSFDAENNETEIIYDGQYGIFPEVTENALAQTIQKSFYGVDGTPLSGGGFSGLWGQLKTVKDENGVDSHVVYDIFGRPTKSISALDSITYPTTITEYDIQSYFQKITTKQRLYNGQASTMDAYSYLDGLGRTLFTRQPTLSGVSGEHIVSGQQVYDSRGLVVESYLPFTSTVSLNSLEAVSTSRPHSSATYDVLNRLKHRANADSTQADWKYLKWTTRIIDENGHQREMDSDAYGRLAKVREYTGADGRFSPPYSNTGTYTLYATTNYAYDSEGNLIGVTDQEGNTTSITYNKLGQKNSMNDPDMGQWLYVYDLNGNLISQTDAVSNVTTFIYDDLNRLTDKIASGAGASYVYDGLIANYEKGRLKSKNFNTNDGEDYTYDILGRSTKSITTIDNELFAIERTFDALSRTASLEYPNETKARYGYDALGRVKSVDAIVAGSLGDSTAPSIPTNLNLSNPTQSSLNLTWTASTDNSGVIDGYQLDVSEDINFTTYVTGYQNLDLPASPQVVTITNLDPSTQYYARLRAYDVANNITVNSDAANGTTSATPDTQDPSTPSNLVLGNATQTTLQLTWTASTDNSGVIDGYQLDVSEDINFTTYVTGYQNLDLPASPQVVTITNLDPSTTYYARLRAYDPSNNVTVSSNAANGMTIDMTAPSIPSNLALGSPTQSSLNLTWTASTDLVGVTGYKLDVSTSPTFATYVPGYENFNLPASPQAYTITGLNPSTPYYARLRAYDAANNITVSSNAANGTTSAPPSDQEAPTIPTNLALINPTQSSLNLTWTASTDIVGVTGYKLDVSTSSTFATYVPGYENFNLPATPQAYTITGLNPSTQYYARLRAYDAANNVTVSSNAANGTTIDTTAPTIPSNLALVNPTQSSLNLTWTASTDLVGVTGYKLDVSTSPTFATYVPGYENFNLPATPQAYTITGLNPSTQYHARLRAYDAANNITVSSNAANGMTSVPSGSFDLNGFTENDPSNAFTKTSSCVTFTNIETRNTNSYLVKAHSTQGNFVYEFDTMLTSSDTFSGETLVWGLGTHAGATHDDWGTNNGVYVGWYVSGSIRRLELHEVSPASSSNSANLSLNQRYYLRATRTGANLTVQIWTNPARSGSPLSTLTDTSVTGNYTSIYAFTTKTAGSSAKKASGDSCGFIQVSRMFGDVNRVEERTGFDKLLAFTSSARDIAVRAGQSFVGLFTATEAYADDWIGQDVGVFTISDPLDGFDVTQSCITLSNMETRTSNSYVHDLHTVGGNFKFRVDTVLTSFTGTTPKFLVWGVSNTAVTTYDKWASGDVFLEWTVTSSVAKLSLKKVGGTAANSGSLVLNQRYYLSIYRTGSDVYAEIYTNPDRTGAPVSTLTQNVGTGSFSRLYVFSTENVPSSSKRATADICNLEEWTLGAVKIVENTLYNVNGQPTKITYGNGHVTDYTYFSGNLRLKTILTKNAQSVTIQSLEYAYDGVGNVTKITDHLTGDVRDFTYDSLNRLVSADADDYGFKSYAYDTIGNMTNNEGFTQVYGAGSPGPHAITSAGSTTFTYDANGSMTGGTQSGQTTTYGYDVENRMTSVTGQINATYAYDDTTQRIKTMALGQTVFFIGELYEETGPEGISYIFMGSQRVASVVNGSVLFYLADHLGGSNILSDIDGDELEYSEYLPYGQFWEHSGGVGSLRASYYFTDQYLDGESGLYYYNARYYNPAIKRFVQPDTIVPDYTDPQSLNRFSYVLNNPLKYTDPSGHDPFTAVDVISLIAGVNSLVQNLSAREFGKAAVDAFGIGLDTAALFIPVATVGAGLTIKAVREANAAADAGKAGKGLSESANFAQKTYKETFSAEGQKYLSSITKAPVKTIDDLSNAIRSGVVDSKNIPVNTIVRDNNTLILNTRTVQALERAGVPRSSFNVSNKTGDRFYEGLLDQQLRRSDLTVQGIPKAQSRGQ